MHTQWLNTTKMKHEHFAFINFLFSTVSQSHISRTVSVWIPVNTKLKWLQVSIYLWRPMCKVDPPSSCLRPVLSMLSFLLERSYFDISPGRVCQAVTFLITAEGCCALHCNEALFVSAAALLSGTPSNSCILQANAILVVRRGFLREHITLIKRFIQRKTLFSLVTGL